MTSSRNRGSVSPRAHRLIVFADTPSIRAAASCVSDRSRSRSRNHTAKDTVDPRVASGAADGKIRRAMRSRSTRTTTSTGGSHRCRAIRKDGLDVSPYGRGVDVALTDTERALHGKHQLYLLPGPAGAAAGP